MQNYLVMLPIVSVRNLILILIMTSVISCTHSAQRENLNKKVVHFWQGQTLTEKHWRDTLSGYTKRFMDSVDKTILQ